MNVTDFKWCVGLTRTQKEMAGVDKLAEVGVIGLIPLRMASVRRKRYTRVTTQRSFPLLPGYVLLGLEHEDQLSEVRELPDIFHGWLRSEQGPVKVPHPQIEWLVNHWPWYSPPEAPVVFRTQVDAFREGGKVLIRSGPFEGHKSTVRKILTSGRGGEEARAIIRVHLFGMTHDVDVKVSTLLPQD